MDSIAVYGWRRSTAHLLDVLSEHAGWRTVAVGHASAAALVRARAETGVPCYQHVLEMLRHRSPGALLIAEPHCPRRVIAAATQGGAELLIDGDVAGADVLRGAAEASRRYGARLILLRPLLGDRAFGLLADLVRSDVAWRPRLLSIETWSEGSLTGAHAAAVAAGVRLLDDVPTQALASVAGHSVGGASALAAHLRYAGGELACLRAGTRPGNGLRVEIEAAAGHAGLHVDTEDGRSNVTITPRDGSPRQIDTSPQEDPIVIEARRAARSSADPGEDIASVLREAAIQEAVMGAAGDGVAWPVIDPGLRGTLRLLMGGAAHRSPPLGRLQLLHG